MTKIHLKKAFFECMFEENYRTLNFYEKEIIDIFDDETFKAEIEEKLLDIVRTECAFKPIPLLILMGKRNEVEEMIENYYKSSYLELTQYTKKTWDGEKYPPCSRRFMSASTILGRYLKVGDKRIKEILSDIADLYEYSEFPVIPTYQNPLFQIWDGVGRKHFFMILDEVAKEHKHGKKIDIRNEIVDICEGEISDDVLFPTTCENFNLADEIIKSGNRRYDLFDLWYKTKDEETIKRVAKAAIEETDESRKAELLSYFAIPICPEELPKKFPFDITPLVSWLEKENYLINEEDQFDATHYILDILMYNRQDICRKVGLKMFYDERFSSGEGRSFAVEIRFGMNYNEAEDKDDFIALFHSPNKDDRIIAAEILKRNIRFGVEGLPLEMIPLALERAHSHARHDFCELLIDKGFFPDELKEEFLYDCDIRTREMFLKTKKPKKQPYNVFLKPPKMPEE